MAEEKNKRRINIHLYNLDMSVNIYPEEEEFYRNGAKLITELMNTYSNIFKGGKSDREIQYMAMLDIALRYEREKNKQDFSSLTDLFQKLTSEIEQAISE